MYAQFLRLLNMSAAGSVLILAVIVLRAVLKKAPRWIPCALWALVAVRLVCPVTIASPLSVFRATPNVVSESGEVELFRPAGGSEKPLLAVGTVQIEMPRTDSETIQEIPGTSLAVTQRSRDAYLPPLAQVYLLGLCVMLLYAVISTLLLRRKVSASLSLERDVRLCDALPSPFILGLARPRIFLPSSLSGEERRLVLAHERAHLRRLDHIWKPLGFLILSMHWFNPLCWLAYVLLCRDIELACDEKVIRAMGDDERAAYSQTLLNCSARRFLTACPVAFGETGVKTRVRAVLSYKKPAVWIIVAAVLGSAVLIVCFAAKPLPKEQDLSFLNYKNAIPLIGMNDTAPYAFWYPAETGSVQPGAADNRALARFLENAEWIGRSAPASSPEPRGYIDFAIEDDYRIIVYQELPMAAVRFGSEVRYYTTGPGDYEAALEAFLPAPSTVPDMPTMTNGESSFDASGRTPAAFDLWGAEAFRQYYFQKAETDKDHDYSHMDLSLLDGMASGTNGTAADTEELTVDVVGALITGNTAEIILRVTAKQLDSLLYDNGRPALKNYRFGDETALFSRLTFGDRDCAISFRYIYSEDDPRLAPNQLELHYLITCRKEIDLDRFTIPLTDFGYYDPSSPGFVTVYKETWLVEIAVDPAAEYDRQIPLEKEVTAGGYRFSVDSVLVTPMACTFRLVCEENEEYVSEHMAELFQICSDERGTVSLTLADGTVLDAGELAPAFSGGQQYPLVLSCTLSFNGPMDPENICSLSLFGTTFPLAEE